MGFKSFGKGLLIILSALCLLSVVLIYQSARIDKRLRDSWENIAQNLEYSQVLKLDKFPVYNQLHSWSCGPTTISMVYTYLKEPRNEQKILEENGLTDRNRGMFPKTFERYLGNSLQGYSVELRSSIPDSEVIKVLYSQLKQGLPVPVYFSTVNDWDKPNYDTHYSALIGIDLKRVTVTIANAYGFEEEVNIKDFLASMKYDNYKNAPFGFRLAAAAGIIKKNNVYVLKKI